jgi:mannose-1-phosphate guanylyltransferase
MSHEPLVYALILAGGAGTRFWPASRASRPKQLLPLLGSDPLLLQTARRVLPLCGWEHILVASGKHLAPQSAALLPDLDPTNLLVEPVPRNTAACIGWATARIARKDPSAVVMVLPSDHHVADEAQFRSVLAQAVASAARGVITTIGIRPSHPETGYGYIEVEAAAPGADVLPVRRFVEKPSRERAAEFVAGGRHLWNAGMFFFRAADMLAAIREHLPALSSGLDAIDRAAEAGRECEEVERVFPELPAISIDHGVMEHMKELAVVPGDFGWNDIGSWQSAWELAKKDERGNSAPEHSVLIDAAGNQVVDLRASGAREKVIALVGVEGLVVVETDDALLIVPRDRAQDVKAVVDKLKERGKRELT